VTDVFIPKKVDKWGRKFGFVKFKEVRDVEVLSKSMEDVWHGTFKLRVNRARFLKGDNEEVSSDGENHKLKEGEVARVKEGLSFKSLLVGSNAGNGKEDIGGVRRSFRLNSVGDLAPLELPVCEETLLELYRSKVAFLKQSVDFQTFNDRLLRERNHDVKATFMGGNMVLLQSLCVGELDAVMKGNKEWWDFCCSKTVPWKPNLLVESREIWIQIYGLPLHAWDEGSFKMVAGRFGVFLDFDEATIAKLKYDVARVKLRTVRRGLIDTVVQLLVKGVKFDVWVVEERCECLLADAGEEEGVWPNSGRASGSSDNGRWQQHDDGDLFSDGKTDSDKSESYKVILDLEKNDNSKGVEEAESTAGTGVRSEEEVAVCLTQSPVEVIVLENVSADQAKGGQIEAENGKSSHAPMVVDNVETLGIRGIADGVGSGGSLSPEKDGDVSSVEEREAVSNSLEGGFEHVERELSGSVLEAGAPHVEAGSIGLYVGPSALTLKPLVEDEYQVEVDPNLHGNHLVEAQSVTLAHVETCPLEPSIVELEEGRVNGGVIGGTVYSDVSESSSQDSVIDVELKTKKKKHVKKKQNHSRPPVPPPGTPTFQKLALAMEASGKRRKAGGSAKAASSS
jgi:hypothetical protein